MNTSSRLRLAALTAVGFSTLALTPARAQSIIAEFYGLNAYDTAGTAAARVGDVNNDGFAEYVLAAPGTGSTPGRAYVVDGRWHILLRIHEGTIPGSMLSGAVAGGVDWNQDTIPDYAIGYPRASVGAMAQAGMVRIFSGKDGSLLHSLFGTQPQMRLGAGLSFFGDVNGDGRPELAVGSDNYAIPNDDAWGMVRIYNGANGMWLRDVGGAFMSGNGFGTVLAPVGDWDGDGAADFAAGQPGYNDDEFSPGSVRIVSGANGKDLATFMPTVVSSYFGRSIAALPDSDGDGKPELLVGAPKEYGVGAVRLISSANKTTLNIWYGQAPNADFGSALAVVGDVDKDGKVDFAATSHLGGPEAMRIFSGATGQTLWQPLAKLPHLPVLGMTVVALGDHDGDGWLDLLLTDSNSAAGGQLSGAAVVVRAALHQPSLGFGGPGNAKLSVHGKPLSAGGYADVVVSVAGPNRPGLLFASLASNPTPIAGGILVPQLSGLMIPFVTDSQGRMEIKGIPGGLGLLSLYAQAVVVNPNQPQGYGFTNAVRIDFLP